MKMKKIILSSLATIALSASLASGATYALFTSSADVNIAVSSGKVKVEAVIDQDSLATFSGKWTGTEYVKDPTPKGTFVNGGTAVINQEGNGIDLVKITPSDVVEFNIILTNKSNVTINYRTKTAVTTSGDLVKGLNFKIGPKTFKGVSSTPWQKLEYNPNKDVIEIIPVTIEMPVDVGNEFIDLSDSIIFTVEALQGNANVEGSLMEQVVTTVADAENGELTIPTTFADVVIPTDALPAGANEVKIAVEQKVDEDVEISDVIVDSIVEGQFVFTTLDLNLVVDNNPVSEFLTEITIRVQIAKGLAGVKVLYNGDGADPSNVQYNSEDGLLSFDTKHFSEFIVVADGKYEVSTAEEIKEAASNPNAKLIRLQNDINVDSYHALNLATLDLDGNTLTAGKFIYDSKDVGVLTIKNGRISVNNIANYVLNVPNAKIERINLKQKIGGEVTTNTNALGNPIFVPHGGGAVNEENGQVNMQVGKSYGPYTSMNQYVGMDDEGFTSTVTLDLDKDNFAVNNAATARFGIDNTMRGVGSVYATERKIDIIRAANGSEFYAINVHAEGLEKATGASIVKVDNKEQYKLPLTAGTYTFGLSWFKCETGKDRLICEMFILDATGNELVRWRFNDLSKKNEPSSPNYTGEFSYIEAPGALWFLGTDNTKPLQLKEVSIYNNGF